MTPRPTKPLATRDLETVWSQAHAAICARDWALADEIVCSLIEFCRAGEIPADCLSVPSDAPAALTVNVRCFNARVLRGAA